MLTHFYSPQPTYEVKSTSMIHIHCEFQKKNILHDSLQPVQRIIKHVSDLSHEIDLFTVFNEMDVAKKRKLKIAINPAWMLKTKV